MPGGTTPATSTSARSAVSTAADSLRPFFSTVEVSTGSLEASWRQRLLVDDGLRIARVSVDSEALQVKGRSGAGLLLVHAHHGPLVLHAQNRDHQVRENDLALIPPWAEVRLHLSRAEFALLHFPPAVLARVLGIPLTALQLDTPRLSPATAQLAEYVRSTSALLTSTAATLPQAYDRDLIRTHAINALTAAVVEAFEITAAVENDADRDAVILRRALAHLRMRLTDHISVPEVAAATGVSVRSLQLVFSRQLNTSPLRHLRTMRLEAARRALEDTTATNTVGEIARRYGYTNEGRFTAHYRDVFGESPAQTSASTRSATSTTYA